MTCSPGDRGVAGRSGNRSGSTSHNACTSVSRAVGSTIRGFAVAACKRSPFAQSHRHEQLADVPLQRVKLPTASMRRSQFSAASAAIVRVGRNARKLLRCNGIDQACRHVRCCFDIACQPSSPCACSAAAMRCRYGSPSTSMSPRSTSDRVPAQVGRRTRSKVSNGLGMRPLLLRLRIIDNATAPATPETPEAVQERQKRTAASTLASNAVWWVVHARDR